MFKMCLWQTLSMSFPTLSLKHSWHISNFLAPAFLCLRPPLTTRLHWPEQMSAANEGSLWTSAHRNWGVETSALCLRVQSLRCVFSTISRSQQRELPPPSSPLPPSGFKSPKTTCTQNLHSGWLLEEHHLRQTEAVPIPQKVGWGLWPGFAPRTELFPEEKGALQVVKGCTESSVWRT